MSFGQLWQFAKANKAMDAWIRGVPTAATRGGARRFDQNSLLTSDSPSGILNESCQQTQPEEEVT